ncbi:MAG: segregation/condensation protein A [Dethiobacteria bacterium]|jgi:segregation and condensation protein A|nr:segregation/condensation protein A [Bacillota bacterium]NMD33406.1 segregation/condensation protein A [Bacillota bacterium]HOB28383.1 segregation/condensation protein A [Bacillota bacterium]HPZ41239.1 segregation/condensation protein A [Bacillota bacterium]HQD51932.1 segregation/condensation protein A [Bacillota bacterium]
MSPPDAYTVKLPVFEGPFDLLFHLIKKEELDIWSVSIAAITEQYLVYLQSMKELNLDIASEFLVMAATLLRLKSKLLLPQPSQPGEEEDDEELFPFSSPEELFERLEEYRRFKEAAGFLKERAAEQQKIFLRSTGGEKKFMVISGRQQQKTYYSYWEGAHLLSEMMNRFEAAAAAQSLAPAIELFDDLPISDRSVAICSLLEQAGGPLPFTAFLQQRGLREILVTFISLLELARRQEVRLLQDRLFGPILVLPAGKGEWPCPEKI